VLIQQYFDKVQNLFTKVSDSQSAVMREAAARIAEAVDQGGIVHLFGTGHSHMLAEEGYYRAGGLAAIRPIFIESLMLHEGAVRSTNLERQEDLAESFMVEEDIRTGDVLVVFSTSGKNPVPIDVALRGKEKGALVVALSSHLYTKEQTSRHRSGKFLSDVADIAIDNGSPLGDAVMQHDQLPVSFASTSTVVGAAIVNAIFAEAIGKIADKGGDPPVFLSGNVEGAAEHNSKLMEKYEDRIDFGAINED
jgi:uncharacterized phosphosugar-binding protein